uniref:Hyaluronan-mediated motility receptor (RHAMM) n=1 Tax=Xiphophorus couchianus TaxID=32473 RepID=A0A3B5LNV4_9TELE
MSFSRAPLKRFNEHIGCAPPPGSYDIKSEDVKGAASFNKSDRFRATRAADLLPPSPSRGVFISPVRRTLSVDGLYCPNQNFRQICLQIRSLVQQRGEQDRRLLALEDDLKKSEAKLLAAVREKTGLSASVVTLARQRAELKKVNEFLKNKVSADATKKRINSLTMELMEARNNLDVKNQELSLLQVNTEGQLKVMETDLQAARTTVSTLQDRNKDLGKIYYHGDRCINQKPLSDIWFLQSFDLLMNIFIQELREEVRVLQEYLDAANDQIQTELEQRTGALQATQDLLKQKEEEANKFQQELQTSKDALWDVEKMLEYQNLELQSAQKSVIDMEKQMKLARQEVEDSQTTVRQQEAELTRLREVLRRTERELDERVAHLEQKCLLSDEERSKAQEEGFRKVEQLKNELIVLQQAKRDERKRQIQLEQEHTALTEELAKEKALVDSLTVLVEKEREETEEQMRQLKEEMEEVLGELAVMEEQEQIRLEGAQKSQEALQSLQRDKEELANQLRDAEALLEGWVNNSQRRCYDISQRSVAQVRHKKFENQKTLLSEVELKKDFSHALENRLSAAERDRDQFQSRLDDVERENAGLRAQLDRSREKAAALEHELDKQQQQQQQDGGALREQLEVLTQEKVTLQWEMEEQRQELQRQLAEAQEKSSPRSEMERWRKQYEELFVKVKPFQEQLNAFAAERDALLNENGANQEELNKLADAYASLLGHQNQKQKIKHVMKLKDENISLKQEVSKLRSLVSRQKSDLDQLRAKLPGARRHRFDPSKAFQNNKENIQTETNDPLGEGELQAALYSLGFCFAVTAGF